jgi:hypothetical protein
MRIGRRIRMGELRTPSGVRFEEVFMKKDC